MALTVTAAESGGTPSNGIVLVLTVVTGGIEAGGAHPTATVSSGNCTTTLTPVSSSSLCLFTCWNGQNSTAFGAAPANNTYTINGVGRSGTDSTNGNANAMGLYTGTVTSGVNITIGAGTEGGAAAIGAYEVQPAAAGVTPLVDASTPATAQNTGGTSTTTASFTPPPGSVLVALIGSDAFPSPITSYAVSDTSGLTWTQRLFLSNTSFGSVGVYTAQVPAATAGISSRLIPPWLRSR